jgi:hypothetical protein
MEPNLTWRLGANDPGWVGWGISAAYLAVAGLWCLAARGGGGLAPWQRDPKCVAQFAVAAALLLLGLNKELDLQTPFIYAVRSVAEAEGWYGWRHIAQWLFIVGLSLAGLGFVSLVVWRLRSQPLLLAATALGLTILVAYVGVRASPIRHVHSLFGWDVSAIPGKRPMMECTALLLLGIGAVASLSAPDPSRGQSSPGVRRTHPP